MLNLKHGNPAFMKSLWNNLNDFEKARYNHENLNYEYTQPNIDLINSIKELHKKIGNFNIDDKHIVITNGASQALSAIMQMKGNSIKAHTPYYYKLNDLATLNKFTFNGNYYNYKIITVPNNPDNCLKEPQNLHFAPVYDLSYYWPQYFINQSDMVCRNDDLALFSLAKLSGYASTRIGWIICSSKETADKLQHIINIQTAGVSLDSQIKAYNILQDLIYSDSFFTQAKNILKSRWEELKLLSSLPFELKNDYGHYIWCKNSKLDNIVEGMQGNFFGVSDKYVRYNIGCSDKEWKEFINICREVYVR